MNRICLKTTNSNLLRQSFFKMASNYSVGENDTPKEPISQKSKTQGQLEYEEVKGDLFTADDNVSLAHCVSADMAMGKGIAKIFKKKFENVDLLKSQNCKVGECAFLKSKKRYVFYLVTKERYFQKPTYDTLKASLLKMKQLIEKHNVQQLAMPKIGCGLDRLNWTQVRAIIVDVFKSTPINIKIYDLGN